MKRILEYKVFDILKNKENEEFLNKVKKENPELYTKFLNIVSNKGLEIAKQKYQEYDPEFVKSEKLRKKRERTKEFKEEKKQQFLKTLEPQIQYIEKILSNSPLKIIERIIKNDEIISNYLKNYRIEKQYKNNFLEFLRNPSKFLTNIKRGKLRIESLNYTKETFEDYFEVSKKILINIIHFYNRGINDKFENYNEEIFWLEFNTTKYLSYNERLKETEFILDRNNEIKNLGNKYVSEKELFDSIEKYSYYLSDKYYKEWKFKNTVSKYNI